MPWFGSLKPAAVDEDRVRAWLAEMAELVADGEVSAKTVNNARTCLSIRSVEVGPQLSATLRGVRETRTRMGLSDGGWLFLCPPPRRGRYSGRFEPVPPSRKTAHDWHEWALQDAGLRDTPLHSLRHTAPTAWLSTGHPLIFVQRQLGHRSITTTEEHYGHLELSFVREAAARTEQRIASARERRVA